jgi:hypothetical protein
MLHDSIVMLRTLFYGYDAILDRHAFTRDDWRLGRTRDDARHASTSSSAAQCILLTVGSARLKFVAELLNETSREDLMKYLFLIATFVAFIGTAAATSPAADCCQGNGKCCPAKCCKK